MKMNDLKQRMQAGEAVYGIFINSGSTIAVEAAALAGFDFVLIDSEHGPTMPQANRDLICAAEYRDAVPIVRVPNGEPDMILRTLDVGAHGVMVPQVNSTEKAQAVADAARYCPMGSRGVATTRAADYGFMQPMSDYFKLANERNLVIVQCENVKAVPHLDAICAIPGVDVVFLGPYDLSSSMGQIGKVDYASIQATADAVLEATKEHGKQAGVFTKNVDEALFYEKLGFRFIVVGTDIGCMTGGMKNIAGRLKEGKA